MILLRWIVLGIVLLVLQSSVIPAIAIYGVRPDLLLTMVVAVALIYGREKGLGAGFFFGVIQDLVSSGFLGLHVLTKMIVGYLVGMTEKKVYKQNLILPSLVVGVISVFYYIVYIGTLVVKGIMVGPLMMIWQPMLVYVVYNMVFAVPIYMLVYYIANLTPKN